ncbi:hypothetical protein BJ742DRAFT_841477 [Cladochytrium replicatum]|nr:hypothetical protein BJ742DRAFT_841477 [Cladochytrium replicatum]
MPDGQDLPLCICPKWLFHPRTLVRASEKLLPVVSVLSTLIFAYYLAISVSISPNCKELNPELSTSWRVMSTILNGLWMTKAAWEAYVKRTRPYLLDELLVFQYALFNIQMLAVLGGESLKLRMGRDMGILEWVCLANFAATFPAAFNIFHNGDYLVWVRERQFCSKCGRQAKPLNVLVSGYKVIYLGMLSLPFAVHYLTTMKNDPDQGYVLKRAMMKECHIF